MISPDGAAKGEWRSLPSSRHVAPGVRIEGPGGRSLSIGSQDPSVAGFVGLTLRGPHHGAHRIESWAEFQDRFGGGTPGAHLPEAVRGFFANGGRVAHICPVGPPGGRAIPSDFLGPATAGRPRMGIAAALEVEEVRLVVAPDLAATLSPDDASAVYRTLIDRVELLADRFVIIDPPGQLDPVETIRWSRPLRSNHAAIYFPWVRSVPERPGPVETVPPSGHIAGTYARLEGRHGVHWPPANSPLLGVVDLVADLGDGEAALLSTARVNPLEALPGRGVRAFGARTLEGDPIHLRRLLTTIRKEIHVSTEWVVFEPRGAGVRKAVIRSVMSYLSRLWREGALAGTMPGQAFYVRCEETLPPVQGDLLLCEIGVAVVRPAEFIVLRIAHRREGGPAPTEGEEANLAR